MDSIVACVSLTCVGALRLALAVVTCSTVAYALKSLTTGKLKGFDVVLAHAAKAAACGFDFRAIVEADLLLPVIYCA